MWIMYALRATPCFQKIVFTSSISNFNTNDNFLRQKISYTVYENIFTFDNCDDFDIYLPQNKYI